MTKVTAEAPRIFPVFTHHAAELHAAARYLVRRIEQYAGHHAPDEIFTRLLDRHRQVVGTLQEMQNSREPYVYLTREDRELVKRVNHWLREHPEYRKM